jgi:CHRD domain
MNRLAMKRLAVCAIAALAIVGASCDDDDNPNGPSNQPTTLVYTANLSPGNEVPPITNAESTGTGVSTMTFHLTRDASGNITTATADFSVTMSGFPAGVIGTAAHIHEAPAGQNAGPLINTGATQGSFTLPNGSGSLVANGVAVTPVEIMTRIINNPAGFYFNVHSQLNQGGFARGQLVLRP